MLENRKREIPKKSDFLREEYKVSRYDIIDLFKMVETAFLIHVQTRYLSPKKMMGVVMGVESFFSSFMTIRVIDNAA